MSDLGFMEEKMFSLRQFTTRDATVIREKQMFTASTEEICGMIKAWV